MVYHLSFLNLDDKNIGQKPYHQVSSLVRLNQIEVFYKSDLHSGCYRDRPEVSQNKSFPIVKLSNHPSDFAENLLLFALIIKSIILICLKLKGRIICFELGWFFLYAYFT